MRERTRQPIRNAITASLKAHPEGQNSSALMFALRALGFYPDMSRERALHQTRMMLRDMIQADEGVRREGSYDSLLFFHVPTEPAPLNLPRFDDGWAWAIHHCLGLSVE